ncbi:MAG: hypothetical protein JW963_00800 [Anaerolineales bacterium]|nr:hypothetical protein [Anaerolineales bacterium]
MISSSKMTADNMEVVRRAQTGNLGAFRAIFIQYSSQICAYLSAQLANPLDAEDLTEEIFVQVWEELEDFELGNQSFEAYLFKIANRVLEAQGNHANHNEITKTAYIPEKWMFDGIYGVMRGLPRLVRQVLILRHVHGLSYEVISWIYSLPPRFLKLLHSMGMRHFNEILKRKKPEFAGGGAAWLAGQKAQLFPPLELVNQASVRLHYVIHSISTHLQTKKYYLGLDIKPKPTPWFMSRKLTMQFVATMAMVCILLFGSIGTALAAQTSLPGEVLYSTKLATEDVRLVISMNPVNDARLHASFALTRLDEIDQLVKLARYQHLSSVMNNLSAHVDAVEALKTQTDALDGKLSATLNVLESGMQVQLDTLTGMEDVLPEHVQTLVVDVKAKLIQEQQAVLAIAPVSTDSLVSLNAQAIVPVDKNGGNKASSENNTALQDFSGGIASVASTQDASSGSVVNIPTNPAPTATAVATKVTKTATPLVPAATPTSPLPTATPTSPPPTVTATLLPPTVTATSLPPTVTATSLPPTKTAVPPEPTKTAVPPTSTIEPDVQPDVIIVATEQQNNTESDGQATEESQVDSTESESQAVETPTPVPPVE